MNIEIPHGHGRSFKKGICDSLLSNKNHDQKCIGENLPYGHKLSYKKGRTYGDNLNHEINKTVK
jgi:hypothetical protein